MCSANGHVRFTPNRDRESDFPQKSPCLLYPRKRTCAVHLPMSTLGQKRTVTPTPPLGARVSIVHLELATLGLSASATLLLDRDLLDELWCDPIHLSQHAFRNRGQLF